MKLTLGATVCVLSVLLLRVSGAQTTEPAYRGDDSDWWSILRDPGQNLNGPGYKPGHSEPSPLNFEIVGARLGYDEMFRRVTSKLGKSDEVSRGDAAAGRDQVCYTSPDQQTYLVFETGEVNLSFYLFTGGPNWDGMDHCAKSRLVSPALRTGTGLHLGQSLTEVKAILGRPSLALKDRLIYGGMVEKRTPPEDLAKARKNNPSLSDKEFHENFDFYTLWTDIEVRFSNSKATYIAVSKSETN